jgi:hypothetical protein
MRGTRANRRDLTVDGPMPLYCAVCRRGNEVRSVRVSHASVDFAYLNAEGITCSAEVPLAL